MNYFGLKISTLLLRFYLVMLIVIGAFATQTLWIAFLALPVFLSCMLGIKIGVKRDRDNGYHKMQAGAAH